MKLLAKVIQWITAIELLSEGEVGLKAYRIRTCSCRGGHICSYREN
jgi:hypothetical protein